MRDLLIFLTFFTTVPVVLFYPHIGVLVWAWISFMNPHRLIPWGVAYDFRFGLICAGVTVFAWLLSREPKRLPWRMTTVLMVLLLCWVSITTVFALTPEFSLFRLEKLTKVLVMALVTLALLQSRERIHALVWVIVVSLGFWGAKGALWTLTGGGAGSGWVFGPPDSFLGDNNEFALALVMTIPLMLYLYTQSQLIWVRAGMAAVSLLCVASIIGSFSRGAFVAAAVVGLALILRSRRRLMIGALVMVSVVGIGLSAPERWVDRIQSITEYQTDGSVAGRLGMWGFAWNLALERPITGGGFDAFKTSNTFARHASATIAPRTYHSIYFQMLGDHGFVGLGIFLALGLSGFISLKRVKKLTQHRSDLRWANDLARMVEVSLVGFAVGGLFYSLAIFDLYYHLIIIALLLRIVVEQQIVEQQPQRFAPTVGTIVSEAGHGVPQKLNG